MKFSYTWLFYILILFNSQQLYSQYNSIWLESIEGVSNQLVNDIVYDPSNEKVYVVGQFEGDISASFPNGSNTSDFANPPLGQNGFLAQYDTAGTLGWALWIGGAGDDRISSIDIGESGSLYICGNFNSLAIFSDIGGGVTATTTSFGGQDAFEAKYSSSGILQWLHEDGGAGDDYCLSVAVDTNFSQVYFLGQFELDPEIGGFNIGNISNTTIESFVLSRNLSGSAQWITETEGIDGDNTLVDIKLDSDSVYIGGTFNCSSLQFKDYLGNYFPILSNIDNNNEIVLASLSQTSGDLNWQAQIKNNSNDILGGLLYLNNSLYLTGALSSNAEFPMFGNVSTTSGLNMFLSKHNAINGATDWVIVETPVGNSNSIGFNLGFDSVNIAVIGTNDGTIRFDGNSANDLVANGVDGFIAFYDPVSGSFFQRKGITSPGTVKTSAISTNGIEQYFFGGGAQQAITVDTISLPFSYSNNGYFGRLALTSPCNTNFQYGSNIYCMSDSNQFPAIMGQSGGVFSSDLASLYFVDSLTGEIAIDSSSDNSYEVYYTLGACEDTFQLEIIDAAFTYSDTSFCNSASNDTAVVLGNYNGAFTSNSPDLALDNLEGIIDFGLSLNQAYSVIHTTSQGCSDTFNLEIISAAISYSDTLYCSGEPNDSAIILGNNNGVFTSSPAISFINTNTGEIDFANSNSLPYVITYLVNGCTDNFDLEIVNSDIEYLDSLYCKGEPNDSAIINGNTNSNAFFYSIPLDPYIDPSIGLINFDSVVPQQYSIIYNVSGCLDTFDLEVESAEILYSNSIYCKGSPDDSAIILGASNGAFSSLSSNIHMDTLSGLINFDSTTIGNYSIVYETPNQCRDTFEIQLASAHFNYTDSIYCGYSNNDTAVILGNSSGVFSSIPSGLSVSNQTGEIDFSNSLDNSYWVYYEVLSTCIDSFPIEVIDLLTNAGMDSSVCGFTYQLMGQPNSNASYSWISFEGLDLSSDTVINPQVTAINDGAYSFELTLTERQCVAVDTVVINFFDYVTVDPGPDQYIDQSTANLSATSNNGTIFYWENLSMLGTILEPDSMTTGLINLVSGDYLFAVTASNGVCPSVYEEVTYFVDWIFIPSGFSPNGDGINDLFLVEGARLNVDFEMQIVNRWGELVFATSDIFTGWDGTINSGWAPVDTYFYFIRVADTNYKGYIELKR